MGLTADLDTDVRGKVLSCDANRTPVVQPVVRETFSVYNRYKFSLPRLIKDTSTTEQKIKAEHFWPFTQILFLIQVKEERSFSIWQEENEKSELFHVLL
jgi:hypothetical protein